MREPKIPPMKIKVQHTIRVKGLGRTIVGVSLVIAAIQLLNKELNKTVKEHKDDIVDAAEKFGEKIGDDDFADRVKDVFDQTTPTETKKEATADETKEEAE